MSEFFDRILKAKSPYIIAELGSNHNGDMEVARKLISAAKEAGADCVKFQSWTKDSIFSKSVYKENKFLNDDYRQRKDYNLEEIVDEFSISEEELMDMRNYARQLKIDCASTPFSPKEADFLVDKIQAPFIKVASMDLNNLPFLEYLAEKRKPMVISTGMSEFFEIDKAVRTIENCGNKEIVILHCVSLYPPKDQEVNLRNIETLQRAFPYPVGFSDHTIGIEIPLASVALGVKLIEKHFTLDTEMFGWDHKVSATPETMKVICNGARRISEAMGSNRIICEENDERKSAFRRSIVLTRDLKRGERLTRDHLDFKRPGTGILPAEVQYVVGRKLAADMAADEILTWDKLD
jgi:sialic acid synthase SpsE